MFRNAGIHVLSDCHKAQIFTNWFSFMSLSNRTFKGHVEWEPISCGRSPHSVQDIKHSCLLPNK